MLDSLTEKHRYKALIKVRDKTATIRLALFDTFRSSFWNFLCRALSHSKEGGSARVDQIPKTVIDEVYKFRIKVNSANYTNIQSGSYSVQAIEWVPRAFNAGPAACYNHPKVYEGPAAYYNHPKEQIKIKDQGTDC